MRHIRRLLKAYRYRSARDGDDLKAEITVLMELAQSQGDDCLAEASWGLERVCTAQNSFAQAWDLMKAGKWKDAWRCLASTQREVANCPDEFADEGNDSFGIEFIRTHTKQFQDLFFLGFGPSPEMEIKSWKCSICGEKILPSSRCRHLPGRFYGGKRCTHLAEGCRFLSLALVKNPVQKELMFWPSSIGKGGDDRKVVEVLVQLMPALMWPFQAWTYEQVSKVVPPKAGESLSRNGPCPCGSGKKYKACCITRGGILSKHYQFSVAPVRIPRK